MGFWDLFIPRINKKIIVDSKEIIKQLLPHGFVPNKFVIVYNGLPGALPFLKRKNPRVKILFFARLEPIKGVNLFIKAIQEINPRYLNEIETHIYGSGTLSQTMKKLEAEFPKNVFYHGFIEGDFQHIFQESDIYVLPSTMEGLPYTVLEAMRAGCCMVITNVGGLPELVENGKSGVLIESQNLGQLTEVLTNLIKNMSLRENLGRAAKDKFDAEFEQGSIFKGHATLFDD